MGGVVQVSILRLISAPAEWFIVASFAATVLGAIVLVGLNVAIASGLLALRTGQSFASVLTVDSREAVFSSLALAPLGWLMAIIYSIQALATLLFALPLYTTRQVAQRSIEMREMFTQTIGALAAAVDKRDPFTARHSERVKEIAVDIGSGDAGQRR